VASEKEALQAEPQEVEGVILFDAWIRWAVRTHLEDLPRVLEMKDLITLKEKLKLIAQEVKGSPLFPTFDGIARTLEFASTDDFRALAENKTLRVIPYLNGYFTDRVEDIRNSLQPSGKGRFEAALKGLDKTVSELLELTSEWAQLKAAAASGIGPTPSGEFIELRHEVDNVLAPPDEKEPLNWNPQMAIVQPNVLLQLSNWLKTIVLDAGWPFDYICSISTSGLPLATMLSAQLRKKFLQVDNQTRAFLPREPEENKRVIVVDTTLQSGKHLVDFKERIESACKARFVGAIVFVNNDLSPRAGNRPDEINSLMEKGQIIYLYKMSELYKLWKAMPEEQVRAT